MDDLWFFDGNICILSETVPLLVVNIIYDNNNATIDKNCELYGDLQFSKITSRFNTGREEWVGAYQQLLMQETRSKLPTNLITMCRSSAHLSEFDENLNEYCLKACQKAKNVVDLCNRYHASLKVENG